MSHLIRLSRKVFHQRVKFSAQEVEPGAPLAVTDFSAFYLCESYSSRVLRLYADLCPVTLVDVATRRCQPTHSLLDLQVLSGRLDAVVEHVPSEVVADVRLWEYARG